MAECLRERFDDVVCGARLLADGGVTGVAVATARHVSVHAAGRRRFRVPNYACLCHPLVAGERMLGGLRSPVVDKTLVSGARANGLPDRGVQVNLQANFPGKSRGRR